MKSVFRISLFVQVTYLRTFFFSRFETRWSEQASSDGPRSLSHIDSGPCKWNGKFRGERKVLNSERIHSKLNFLFSVLVVNFLQFFFCFLCFVPLCSDCCIYTFEALHTHPESRRAIWRLSRAKLNWNRRFLVFLCHRSLDNHSGFRYLRSVSSPEVLSLAS